MIKNNKILFVINSLSKGGAENVFINDINILTARGFDCRLALVFGSLDSSGEGSRLSIDKTRVWELNFKNLYDINAYIRFFKRINSEQIGIVYSTLNESNFVMKIIRVFKYFKLYCREANEARDKPYKYKISDIVLNFFVYKLVMVAESVRSSYSAYDPFSLRKMVILHNGVNIPEISSYDTPKNGPTRIIAVGSFTPKKGFTSLIDICKKLATQGKDFFLEIIGDGVLFDEISQKIIQLKLQDKIKCIKSLNKEELEKHYLSCEIFVLTSEKEGCPNVLLESMSYGLAPICFDVGAVPEILENTVSGFVIKKRDQGAFTLTLNKLIGDRNLIQIMGKEAKKRVRERFSMEIHIQNLLELFELKHE